VETTPFVADIFNMNYISRTFRLSLLFCFSALAVLSISTVPVYAQDSVAQSFQNPSDSAKPQTWWHWVSGNVTSEGITADLAAMKQIGLGGAQLFTVDQGPAGPIRYMSPEWRALVQHAIAEAKKNGLQLSITDCEGWSESGGPWITPALSMQKVVYSTTNVTGGRQSINLPRPEDYKGYYKDIVVLAFPAVSDSARIGNVPAKAGYLSDENGVNYPDPPIAAADIIDPKSIVDLSTSMKEDGTLSWIPPAGKWTILRMGMTSTGTPIHPAMPETVGLECDKFSPEAVTANWNGAMANVMQDSGSEAGKTLKILLMDSWEAGTGNWTPLMPQDFQSRFGYSPILWLPTFTGRVVGSVDQTERFLWDFRRTMADLVAVNHYGLMRTLAHQHGMLLQAEATGIGLPTVSDEIQCKSFTDIPMGEFWIGNEGTLSDDKEAASAAHIYGKQIVAAESYTADPSQAAWTNDPFGLKAEGDLAFCTGVNRMVMHRYAMQPYLNRAPGMTMGPWGLNFERTNTWWKPGKAWISYIARCQSILQTGHFVADVCYYYGQGAPQDVGGYHFDPERPAGYDYDVCNSDIILNQMSVGNGLIKLKDGMTYRVLVLPNTNKMTVEVAAKIQKLVADGAVVVGPKPEISPSLSNYPQSDNEISKIAQQVWGDCNGTTITTHSYGKGRVVWGESLNKVLASVVPDFVCSTKAQAAAASEIHYIHRSLGSDDYYFVANHKYKPIDAVCTFRVSHKVPELWYPESGKIERAAAYTVLPGRIEVPIHFNSAGSVFVVFRNSPTNTAYPEVIDASDIHTPSFAAPHHVKIISAEYGIADKMVDVTKEAAAQADSDYSITANNALNNGNDPAFNVVKELTVAYELDGQSYTKTVAEGQKIVLISPPADAPPVYEASLNSSGALLLRPWLNGKYQVKFSNGVGKTVTVTDVPAPVAISGPWNITFPAGWGAPASYVLPELTPWNHVADDGVKYFSGTATYAKDFTVNSSQTGNGKSLYLDLGMVKNLVDVSVNGHELGVLWKEPFIVDISSAVVVGKNTLSLRVTNLWPNRLIGDSALPVEKRYTWTVVDLYNPKSALLDSGLLGPVTLLTVPEKVVTPGSAAKPNKIQ
jgi:hypothetical protein